MMNKKLITSKIDNTLKSGLFEKRKYEHIH